MNRIIMSNKLNYSEFIVLHSGIFYFPAYSRSMSSKPTFKNLSNNQENEDVNMSDGENNPQDWEDISNGPNNSKYNNSEDNDWEDINSEDNNSEDNSSKDNSNPEIGNSNSKDNNSEAEDNKKDKDNKKDDDNDDNEGDSNDDNRGDSKNDGGSKKESLIDYVLERASLDLPPNMDADGGGD